MGARNRRRIILLAVIELNMAVLSPWQRRSAFPNVPRGDGLARLALCTGGPCPPAWNQARWHEGHKYPAESIGFRK